MTYDATPFLNVVVMVTIGHEGEKKYVKFGMAKSQFLDVLPLVAASHLDSYYKRELPLLVYVAYFP